MYGNGFCGSGFGWGMGHGPGLFFFLMAALVIWAVWSRVRTIRPEGLINQGDAALELLRRRYAAGEVSEEEFQMKKSTLQA